MISENSILRFARGTRLQHDRVRDVWFIQAPERAFHADPIAVEVLQLIDGTRNVGAYWIYFARNLPPHGTLSHRMC